MIGLRLFSWGRWYGLRIRKLREQSGLLIIHLITIMMWLTGSLNLVLLGIHLLVMLVVSSLWTTWKVHSVWCLAHRWSFVHVVWAFLFWSKCGPATRNAIVWEGLHHASLVRWSILFDRLLPCRLIGSWAYATHYLIEHLPILCVHFHFSLWPLKVISSCADLFITIVLSLGLRRDGREKSSLGQLARVEWSLCWRW